MKTYSLMLFFFILVAAAACKKNSDDGDYAKITGVWSFVRVDGISGFTILGSEDTMTLTSDRKLNISSAPTLYNYYLQNNTVVGVHGTDTVRYKYEFLSDSRMKMTGTFSTGDYMDLTKIK